VTIVRTAPEPFGSLIERITADDRRWFEEHSLADERIRRYAPGERWPLRYPDTCRVLVVQIKPGFRMRHCDAAPIEPPYDADEAAVLAEHVACLTPEVARKLEALWIEEPS
jgi:hypothetical protein